MSATYTLSTTNLSTPCGKFDTQVYLASTSGLVAGMRLWIDRELMSVTSLAGFANLVNVRRGVDGTFTERHGTAPTVYFGPADQFFSYDPHGRPREDLLVSPHINIRNGNIWFAQGDGVPNGERWWQLQTVGHTQSGLGERQTTPNPTSSQ